MEELAKFQMQIGDEMCLHQQWSQDRSRVEIDFKSSFLNLMYSKAINGEN
jgi:hypothetical protein